MSSIRCAGIVCVEVEANHADMRPVSAARVRKIVRLLAVALAAASLAACAQSSVISRNFGFFGATRQASLEHHRTASVATSRSVASAMERPPFAPRKDVGNAPMASQGVAS
jgi:rare lipoprotein A